MEHCTIRIDRISPSSEEFRSCFSRVFRTEDANPRPLLVKVCATNDCDRLVAIDVQGGNPVFHVAGGDSAVANFRGRWLPEHEVPLMLNPPGKRWFVMLPTDGNRLRVRCAKWWERWFA